MELIIHAANILSTIAAMILQTIALKYVFCKDLYLNKMAWIIIIPCAIIVSIIQEIYSISYLIFATFVLFPALIILRYSTEHRIKNLIFVIPSIVIVSLPVLIISLIFSVFSFKPVLEVLDNELAIIFLSYIYIVAAVAISFVFILKLSKIQMVTYLKKWDYFAFYSLYLISLIALTVINELQKVKIYGEDYDKLIVSGFGIVVVLLNFSVIYSITKSKSANFYKDITFANERYMAQQLHYFENYKATQIETKRLKHDMKNHIFSMGELCNQEKYTELMEYLNTLQNAIYSIDKTVHIGNDIADAIINEKSVLAKQKGIAVSVEGSIRGIDKIKPIDICTIFANAFDNAIEACESIGENEKYISILAGHDRNYAFLSFTNSIANPVFIKNNRVRSNKKDYWNHGFGLINIVNAVKKYNGEYKLSSDKKEFTLEIILLI